MIHTVVQNFRHPAAAFCLQLSLLLHYLCLIVEHGERDGALVTGLHLLLPHFVKEGGHFIIRDLAQLGLLARDHP